MVFVFRPCFLFFKLKRSVRTTSNTSNTKTTMYFLSHEWSIGNTKPKFLQSARFTKKVKTGWMVQHHWCWCSSVCLTSSVVFAPLASDRTCSREHRRDHRRRSARAREPPLTTARPRPRRRPDYRRSPRPAPRVRGPRQRRLAAPPTTTRRRRRRRRRRTPERANEDSRRR